MNIDEIESSLKKDLDHYRKAAAALSAVEIGKTKSGREYANLTNAIKNARRVNEYGFDRLRVVFPSLAGPYDDATIDLYGYQDELPEEDPRRVAPVVGYVRQKYTLTAEEVRERIRENIERYTRRAEETEKELTMVRGYITAFRTAVAAAEEELQKAGAHIAYMAKATR